MKLPLIQQCQEILEVKKNVNNGATSMPVTEHSFTIRMRLHDEYEMEWTEKAELEMVE